MRDQLVEAERALATTGVPESAVGPDRPAARPRARRGRRDTGGWPRRWPTSTARPSPPPTSSASWCSARSASPATPTPARLVEDLDDLLREVVDDLYLRASPTSRPDPAFCYAEAMAIARTAVGDPQARLEPAARSATTPSGRRVAFADAVRAEMERRKRRLGILSYDDLLSQLAHALEEPRRAGPGPDAAALADRPGRRVPGHRPGAVGGPRPGLHRPRDDGADRRPQAGDLRLPRRRRHDLPAGGRDRHDPQDAAGQLAQRRSAPGGTPDGAGAVPRSATHRIVVHDVTAHHAGLLGWPGAPHRRPVPDTGASGATSSARRGPEPLTVEPGPAPRRARPRPRRPVAARVGRDLRGPAAPSRGTSRSSATATPTWPPHRRRCTRPGSPP